MQYALVLVRSRVDLAVTLCYALGRDSGHEWGGGDVAGSGERRRRRRLAPFTTIDTLSFKSDIGSGVRVGRDV